MSNNEALICTKEDCKELQIGDCEFCEKHAPNVEEQATVIYQHNIKFSWHDGAKRELDECDIEHIQEMIKEGCNQGELCQVTNMETGDEASGWWSIVR